MLITFGVLFLFVMLGGFRIPIFLTLFYFWPVFLIGAGIGLLFWKYPVVRTLVFFVQLALFLLLGSYIAGGGTVDFATSPDRTLIPEPDVVLTQETPLAVHYEMVFASGNMDAGEVDLYQVETHDRQLNADFDPEDKLLTITNEGIGLIAVPGNRNSSVFLSRELAWDVQLDGVFSRVNADLDEIQLNSLLSKGAFNSTVIRLPEPEGTVPITLDSGFASTAVYLPAGTPVSIAVDKGLSQVAYGPTSLKDDSSHHLNGYAQATDRYEVVVDVGFGSVTFKEY